MARARGKRSAAKKKRAGRISGGRISAKRRASPKGERANERVLITAARNARDYAFAPFSRFKVGCALRTSDGRIYTGCNVENASFGLTLCAERVAIFKAISETKLRNFSQVVIFTDAHKLTPPCGACRQVLWEFAPDAQVILANARGRVRHMKMKSLIPLPFDSSDLL